VKSLLEVGEGTNESIDLDKFDNTTTHLFFGMRKKIAGAYRMGLGSEIFPNMVLKVSKRTFRFEQNFMI
jgi:hypothetical protein